MRNQRDYEEHEKDKEQYLGDTCGGNCHATESENRGHNRHYQKD
jgi:hypothetical protein